MRYEIRSSGILYYIYDKRDGIAVAIGYSDRAIATRFCDTLNLQHDMRTLIG